MNKTLAGLCVLAFFSAAMAQDTNWNHKVLIESKRGLNGAAIGDLDPAHQGNEVVSVNSAGQILMACKDHGQWASLPIHEGAGELIMCAIGDADARFPGNEFVGVGMLEGEESLSGKGQVLLLRKDPEKDNWIPETIYISSHAVHGVAIGDVVREKPGNEIVVVGFNHRVEVLTHDKDSWSAETIYVANRRLKIALIEDIKPEIDGNEILVCGTDGQVVLLSRGKLGWCHEVMYADPVGQSRIAFGKTGILSGGDDGKVTLMQHDGCNWNSDCLARDTGKIRGVSMADLDPDIPGQEIYFTGYSKKVSQVSRNDKGYWSTRVIFAGEGSMHHLVSGELEPEHEGLELVVCGHDGRLVMLQK